MDDVYQSTVLTPIKVAKASGYIDWASQPSLFKHYPKFLYRYKYVQNKTLKVLELSRVITSVTDLSGTPYKRLNTPSAGNLHPVELYVQIRGLKGVISGVYHVNAEAEELVLIQEIDADGIEPYFGKDKKFIGMIFLLSIVPFRSVWKYGERAIRYCYLDVGHQLGAVDGASKISEQKMTILSLTDSKGLSKAMGFRDDEFICAAAAIGECNDKSVIKLHKELIYVAPTDYIEANEFVTNIAVKQKHFDSFSLVDYDVNENAILTRRSSRIFANKALSDTYILKYLSFLSSVDQGLESYFIVLKSHGVKLGVYQNSKLIQEGDFTNLACGILVDQNFIKNSSLICVMTAKSFSASHLIQAGAFAHAIGLDAQVNGIGFSGIGAFYDKKMQTFLGTDNCILYVNVLGTQIK